MPDGGPALQAGLALHYGTVSYGNIGSGDRLDFTVIGADVNLTSRIEQFNRQLDRALIMSQAFAEQLGRKVWEIGHYELRGFAKLHPLFALPPEESGEAVSLSAAGGEEAAQQVAGGALGDPAIDFRAVMAGRLVENSRAVLDAAAFRVVSPEIKPADAREADRRGAHRARFKCHVQVATGEALGPEPGGAFAQYQHLGMRGRVAVAFDPVPGSGNEGAGRVEQHRADRHLAVFGCHRGFGESKRHCAGRCARGRRPGRAGVIAPGVIAFWRARPICSLHTPPPRPPGFSENAEHTLKASRPGRDWSARTHAPERIAPERIAKAIARAGLCSRRDAERWIAEGRIAVNGEVLTSPAVTVTADCDIRVDGKKLPEPERPRLWRYHKPVGLVTTHRDEKGRPTVFGALPAELPRLISVGRLDLNSEGLLLLTNDGALARRLELPATGWVRRYRARVHGAVDPARLAALARGTTIEGVAYGPIRAALDRTQGSNAWLTLSLHEGKNREVRRVLEHLGYSVTRLIRVAYGPFQLGLLGRGEIAEVPAKVLREQLGGSFAVPGARRAGRLRGAAARSSADAVEG